MNIAIASGKGGTGKTTLAVNTAVSLAADGWAVRLLDCDVEEPDCHLYLRPTTVFNEPVTVLVPSIEAAACTHCGLCARACEFHALVALPGTPLLLPELCHGCGVCGFVCPEQAITDGPRAVGTVSSGEVAGLHLRWGTLQVGEARATPVIGAVKQLPDGPAREVVIIDAPPGAACAAVEAMRSSDFTILVTEPTPFGVHDLRLVMETVRALGIPHGVVINRAGMGDESVRELCRERDVPLLLEIPQDLRIAQACSRGEAYAQQDPSYAASLVKLATGIRQLVRAESGTDVGADLREVTS